MIFTEVGSLGNYRGIGKYLDIAIDYLLSHPLKDVQAGHYEIDGKNVFFGYVFSAEKSVNGTVRLVCYDQIRYLLNKDT